MVSTRRSTANADAATNGSKKSQYIPPTNGTINFLQPDSKRVDPAPVTPKVSGIALNKAPSSNISDHDLSLTSPFTDENSNVAMTTPRKQQSSSNLPERSVSSALRRLAPKPFGNMSGSSHNPIIVNENSSPPRPAVRAPKRKHRHRKIPEPHKFMDQGFGDVYNYRVARAPLATLAMPANGSTFTGHQSHDIYRMMNAKMVAAPGLSPNAAWGRDSLNVPFQVQYPISAQYLSQQQQQARLPQPSPCAQHYQARAPPNAYPIVPSQNEDMLRKKAVQYIRDVSRPSPRKRRLSDANADSASADEAEMPKLTARTPAEETPAAKTPPQSALMALWGAYYPESPQKQGKLVVYQVPDYFVSPQKRSKPVVYQDPDPNFDINHLIEHTSIITSLLRAYSQSKDQKGLRKDISMMMNVQSQRMTEWMKAESQASRKRRKSNDDSANREVQAAAASAAKAQKEQDSAVRDVLSASANMWQDGTGHGVADVFAVEPASSPAASVTASVLIQPMEVSGAGGDVDSPSARPASIQAKETSSPDTNRISMKAKLVSPSNKSKGFSSASMSYVDKPKSPTDTSVNENNEASNPVNRPVTPNGSIASPAIEQSSQLVDKSSTPNEKPPATEKTPQPANKLQTPHHKLSTLVSKRLSSRKPSFSRVDKLHVSSNKIPSSRDVTPTPSSSCLHSESSEPDQMRRPIFRFERRVTVEKTMPVPTLRKQETTKSMKKMDAEYRVLTKEYLEAQGLGEVSKGER